jgi:hypothetical protein
MFLHCIRQVHVEAKLSSEACSDKSKQRHFRGCDAQHSEMYSLLLETHTQRQRETPPALLRHRARGSAQGGLTEKIKGLLSLRNPAKARFLFFFYTLPNLTKPLADSMQVFASRV